MLLDRLAHAQSQHGFQQQGKPRAARDLVGCVVGIKVEGQKTLGALSCGRLAQTHAAETAASRRSFPHARHSGEHRDDAFEKLVRPGCIVAEHELQGLQSIDDGGALLIEG
ncbi:MAG TPA: hypothetical protein VJ801_18950 [Polyangia bacterium]|nr:hypothetical protein [Polyangia bacterium]